MKQSIVGETVNQIPILVNNICLARAFRKASGSQLTWPSLNVYTNCILSFELYGLSAGLP